VNDVENQNLYAKALFTGRASGNAAFLAAVLKNLPANGRGRVLELGCGTGDLTFALGAARPELEIVGLDISEPNIKTAAARARDLTTGRRPEFVSADYREWRAAPFDAIIADSVLQLIAIDDEDLVRRLAGDLRPGGYFIATMPERSLRNSIMVVMRRLWRGLPKSFDRLALAGAKAIYARESADLLAERIGYLRILPERLYDLKFHNLLAAAGLRLITSGLWIDPSIFKLKHRLIVYGR
jgi:trans-aconitate 2-methyltransferase